MEDIVPISSLNYRTRNNLKWLESQGFSFGDSARRVTIYRRNQRLKDDARRQTWAAHGREYPRKKDSSYYAKSFYVDGYDPDGNPITFCRRETATPGAGQTFIKTPYGNIRLLAYKKLLSGREVVRPGRAFPLTELERRLEGSEEGDVLDYLSKLIKRRAKPKLPTYTSKGALLHYFPGQGEKLEPLAVPSKKELVELWKELRKDFADKHTKKALAKGYLSKRLRSEFPEVEIGSPAYNFIWESLVESEELGEYL